MIARVLAGSRPRRPGRGRRLLFASLAGAVGAYFLDPDEGARRRSQAAGRAGALLRRGGSEVAGEAHDVKNRAVGAAHALEETAIPSDDEVEPDQSTVRAPVTAEEPVAEAEPPPDERAARDEGRGPAPFGSADPPPS